MITIVRISVRMAPHLCRRIHCCLSSPSSVLISVIVSFCSCAQIDQTPVEQGGVDQKLLNFLEILITRNKNSVATSLKEKMNIDVPTETPTVRIPRSCSEAPKLPLWNPVIAPPAPPTPSTTVTVIPSTGIQPSSSSSAVASPDSSSSSSSASSPAAGSSSTADSQKASSSTGSSPFVTKPEQSTTQNKGSSSSTGGAVPAKKDDNNGAVVAIVASLAVVAVLAAGAVVFVVIRRRRTAAAAAEEGSLLENRKASLNQGLLEKDQKKPAAAENKRASLTEMI